MTTYAQYDATTGEIYATNSQYVSNEALAALGRAQVLVADDVNGGTHTIDVATLEAVPITSLS